jgi:hypothetical protein
MKEILESLTPEEFSEYCGEEITLRRLTDHITRVPDPPNHGGEVFPTPRCAKVLTRWRMMFLNLFRSELLVHLHLERITLVLGGYRAHRIFLCNLILDLDNAPLSRSEVRGKSEK